MDFRKKLKLWKLLLKRSEYHSDHNNKYGNYFFVPVSCFPHPGNQEDYNLSSPFHGIRADARMITYAFDHALFLVIYLVTACLFLPFQKIHRIKKGWLNELTALSDEGPVISCRPLAKD